MIRVLFSVLVFLFPLGAYCFILGRINRRRHPVLVSGVQDCAGLLLALSGLSLVVGPGILTGFHYRPRDVWLYYHYHTLPGLGPRWGFVGWALVWLVYWVVVVVGAGWLLGRRRAVSVIYNVDAADFDDTLGRVLDYLGLDWAREGRQVRVRDRRPVAKVGRDTLPVTQPVTWPAPVAASLVRAGGEVNGNLPASLPAVGPNGREPDTILEVEPWPVLRHVTLTWTPGGEPLRRDIEAVLKDALANVWTPEHAVGVWLQTASALLFLLMFFLTVLYQYLSLRGGHVGI